MATYTHLASVSPTLPELSHDPLDTAFADLANSFLTDTAKATPKKGVSDILQSLTSPQHSIHSYKLVEEDDYEQSQITPKLPKTMAAATHDREEGADIPIRTASISRHLPMHNPVPDLQSLQGAYIKNVERLEDHAERMSLAESMEEELKKMKQEIKRSESTRRTSEERQGRPRKVSYNSASNMINTINATARAGGFSPAEVASPIGSVRSQRRTASNRISRSNFLMLEPQLEGRPLDSTMTDDPPTHAAQQHLASWADSPRQSFQDERPTTSDSRASNDTYRKAQNLFTDFDGTHFSPLGEIDHASRRISLNAPPLARDSRAFKEAQPGESMVYYPAPVPVMLNLPQRLSKMNWTDREKRRLQGLSNIPDEMRKSAVWLNGMPEDDIPRSRPVSSLPPQLRASAFFDQPSQSADVKLKHGSAVLTLDSILDAAAHAPVSAFTDHPIVGHLGQEVYGAAPKTEKQKPQPQKRRSTLSNMLTRRSSQNLDDTMIDTPDDDPEKVAERSLAPDDDEIADDEGQAEEGEDGEATEEQHQLGFLGAPTTLLAELQMRKAQQKLRNRTAANAFPNGMHSTLLELDAVAQLQQKSRKQKHVALAWEDQEAIDRENNDDEDVPLGVLFPEKNKQTYIDQHRPLGLMEKKELEENEPLSSRRARLRGEPLQPVQKSTPQPSPRPEDMAPALNMSLESEGAEEEQEGETLAQRRVRLAAQAAKKQQMLTDAIATELGTDAEQTGGARAATPEVEETLGQRRKRLQQEREAGVRANGTLKPKTSMGDLLRANPVGSREAPAAGPASKVDLLAGNGNTVPLVGHIQSSQPSAYLLQQPNRYGIPPPYYPNQPLLGHGMQAGGFTMPHTHSMPQVPQLPQYQAMPLPVMQHMNSFQSTPNLNINAYGMQSYHPALPPSMNLGGMYGMGGMGMPQMAMPTQNIMTGFGMNGMSTGPMPGYDPIATGPPLDNRQREHIMKWRSNVT